MLFYPSKKKRARTRSKKSKIIQKFHFRLYQFTFSTSFGTKIPVRSKFKWNQTKIMLNFFAWSVNCDMSFSYRDFTGGKKISVPEQQPKIKWFIQGDNKLFGGAYYISSIWELLVELHLKQFTKCIFRLLLSDQKNFDCDLYFSTQCIS